MTLHPQAVAALELWSQGPSVTDPGFGAAGIAAMRADALAAAALEPREPLHRVTDVDADGVPCRLFVPTDAATHAVLVFLHGGGFVFGDVETHDGQSRRLAARTGLAVLAVDYRRPPEHRFPAACEDVDTVLRWLGDAAERHGLDAGRVAVIGDSAGGNLALVASLRNPGRFAATVLVYPFLDPAQAGASYASDTGGLTAGQAAWYWEQYADGPDDLRHPHLAPLEATTDDLGRVREPVLVQVAEHDVLADEDLLLARRLEEAGVDVRVTTYPGMIHGFWRHPELFDAAEQALAEAAAFLAAHLLRPL